MWMVVGGRRLVMRSLWFYVVTTFLVAFAFSCRLLLLIREMRLQARVPGVVRDILRASSLAKPKEDAHAIELGVEFAPERPVAWRCSRGVSNVGAKRPVDHRNVAPSDHAIAPQQGQRVVAAEALRDRRVRLEAVLPAPESLEAIAIPHDRIKRRQQLDALFGWPP
jgi:hypothetical protein